MQSPNWLSLSIGVTGMSYVSVQKSAVNYKLYRDARGQSFLENVEEIKGSRS